MLNIVEKVIALEGVELLKNLTPDQLARIASIATVQKLPPDKTLLDPGRALDALYVVLDGSVELSRDGARLHVAEQNEVLGSWALFDEAPLPVVAKTLEDTTMLRIGRDDFHDLLSDNIEIMTSIMAALVRRFRMLVER